MTATNVNAAVADGINSSLPAQFCLICGARDVCSCQRPRSVERCESEVKCNGCKSGKSNPLWIPYVELAGLTWLRVNWHNHISVTQSGFLQESADFPGRIHLFARKLQTQANGLCLVKRRQNKSSIAHSVRGLSSWHAYTGNRRRHPTDISILAALVNRGCSRGLWLAVP